MALQELEEQVFKSLVLMEMDQSKHFSKLLSIIVLVLLTVTLHLEFVKRHHLPKDTGHFNTHYLRMYPICKEPLLQIHQDSVVASCKVLFSQH